MSGEKHKKLITDAFVFAIGNIGSKLVTFFLVPLYTNVLLTEEFGMGDFIITCSNLLVPILSLTIQDAVLRFGLTPTIKKESVIKSAVFVCAVGSIVAILLLPLENLYSQIAEWKIYLTIITITNMIGNVCSAYAKVKNKNRLFAFAGIIQTLVLALVNIALLVVVKCGIHGYLVSNIVANIVYAIILIKYTNSVNDMKIAKINHQLTKEMIIYSLPLIANNLSWWVLNSSDRVMIAKYLSASELGIYVVATKIPNLLTVISAIFTQAWSLSAITEYENDKEEEFYSEVFTYFSIVMFLSASTIMTIIQPFMSVYVSVDYYYAWICVPSLIIGVTFYSFGSFFGSIYGIVKKNINVTLSTILAAIINILINLCFLKKYGIMAAAISTAFSFIFIGIYRIFDSRKYFAFIIDLKKLFINSGILIFEAYMITMYKHSILIGVIGTMLLILINRTVIRKGLKLFFEGINKFWGDRK